MTARSEIHYQPAAVTKRPATFDVFCDLCDRLVLSATTIGESELTALEEHLGEHRAPRVARPGGRLANVLSRVRIVDR